MPHAIGGKSDSDYKKYHLSAYQAREQAAMKKSVMALKAQYVKRIDNMSKKGKTELEINHNKTQL